MPIRPLATTALALMLATVAASSRPRTAPAPGPDVKAWVAGLVTRVGDSERALGTRSGRGRRSIDVTVRVAADGMVSGIEVGAGSPEDAARAREAIRDAGPFPRPPPAILADDGHAELAFPLALTP